MELKERYHLHQRAQFFTHHGELNLGDSVEEEVDKIFENQVFKKLEINLPKYNPKALKKLSAKKKQERFKEYRQQCKELNVMWVRQMMESDKGLLEKATLFWSGHFACKTDHNPYLTIEFNNLIRKNALGNFRDLLMAVSKSQSMIQYLHLKQNKKAKPNEDFARELCELFTLGRDIDYSEKDIQEIARAFTGWGTDEFGDYFFNEKQHDTGVKKIFGVEGNFKGEDVIDMILENRNTAKHISKKVYQFYMAEQINEKHLEELTDIFYESNYEISELLKYLFKAKWFYKNQGKLIKSPVEFLVVMGKMLGLKYAHDKTLFRLEHYMGQVLFSPPNVAGWPSGRQWIDSSRLAMRLRLGSLILNRGYIQDELSPELDEMLMKKQKKQKIAFSEDVDWEKFWEKNEGADIFDLIIRCENEGLKLANSEKNKTTIIHLLSTPDYQLI